MEITGKIIAVLEPTRGVGQRTGKEWVQQDFVLETVEQYPKRMCFAIKDANKLQQFNIQIGEMLTVHFDINAREWNGKWFNDFTAWNVVRHNL